MRDWLKVLLILMLMVLLVVLWRIFGGMRITRVPPGSGDVTRALRRGAFSGEVRDETDGDYVEAQLEAIGRPLTPDEIRKARDELAVIRRPPRSEFHLRHVTPDSLIRRLTMQFLRAPSRHGYETLRRFYAILGAGDLLALWDELYRDLQAGGGNWYQVLGARRAEALRRYLTNLRENLFLSEAQGNLHAGTHIDLTEEGIVILGEQRIRRIVDITVEALETFGLMPRISVVGREFMLGYEGASGELFRYGYDRRRPHDEHVDPLRYMDWSSAEIVLRNTRPWDLVRYFRAHWNVRRLLYGCLLFIVMYYLLSLPVGYFMDGPEPPAE